MKKLLLVLVISIPVFSFAQNKITLVDSTQFLAGIEGLYRTTLVFQKDVKEINTDRIDISKVASIAGETPQYRKRAILKRNPSVVFLPGNYTKQDLKSYQSGVIDDIADIDLLATDELTAGDYIYRAGQRYLTGLGVAFTGGVIAGIGASQEEESLYIIGGATMLTGFIVSITGHVQLKKAGTKMNQDAITMSAAQSGLGVAINF